MEDTVGVSLPRCTLEPPHYDGIQSLCLMGDLLFSGSRDSCIKQLAWHQQLAAAAVRAYVLQLLVGQVPLLDAAVT